jgi:hypothetical protein
MQRSLEKQPVLGIIETVAFPELGVSEVLAKVDTGAYSGAIHCESIEETINEKTGKKMLTIVPIDASNDPVVVTRYARVYARSSSGHRSKRYVITTKIIIQGKTYDIRIGVTQRSMMNVKVLVGRRFIRKNHMLVDVTQNQELDTDGGRKL